MSLPDPWDYCYEWDGPYGARKFSSASHNGTRPARSIPIFTADQMRDYAAAAVEAEREACAVACTDYAKRHAKDDDDSKARAWMMLQCAAAIRARSTASASRTKGDKPALESAPDASSAPCR